MVTLPDSNEHVESRLVKLENIMNSGIEAYPHSYKPDAKAGKLQEKYKDLPDGTDTEDNVCVAGRIMANRNSGMFIDLLDDSGKIQIFSHKANVITSYSIHYTKLYDSLVKVRYGNDVEQI